MFAGECQYLADLGTYTCTLYDRVKLASTATGATLTLLTAADEGAPVCGMCGNNNNIADDDNQGQHMCQYSDLGLMAVSALTMPVSLLSRFI